MKFFIISLFGLFALASAAKHHLFVGTFAGAYLYALEFDDVTMGLTLEANISASDSHSWIALSHDKEALYAVGEGSWYSYIVNNGTSLTPSGTVAITGNCSSILVIPGAGPGGGLPPGFPPPGLPPPGLPPPGIGPGGGAHGLFIMGAATPPYDVYGTAGNCGNVLSVNADTGALNTVAQNISYYATSAMHGMVISPDGQFLYSVDALNNSIWTYTVQNETGLLNLVNTIDGPVAGSNPRHAAIHPSGQYLYIILEEANELAQYAIDPKTGFPVWQNITYPLIKPGLNTSLYWSDEVMISSSTKYLWASSRAHNVGTVGYISAFSLSPTGAIEEQLFLTNTTTSGGAANAITPAPFSDEFVALADAEKSLVQVWQFKNDSSTEVVAQISLDDGGCCANAVWYD